MHILMISDVYFPRVNGVSTSIRTFRNELVNLGHEVTLIAPQYGAETQHEDWIIRVPSRAVPLDPEDRFMQRSYISALATDLKWHKFDLLHIQTPFVAHYAGIELSRKLDLPRVVTYHTHFEEYFHHYLPLVPRPLLKGVARFINRIQCNQVNAVIVPSTAMQEVLGYHGVSCPVEVIATGLSQDLYRPGDGFSFRQKLDIPQERPVLIHIGRVAHEKNIGFLLQMVDVLRGSIPDLLFIIAGEGPAQDHLISMVKKLDLEPHVRFVGNLDRATELLDCYRAGDVFVFGSRTETQGLVLLEAMAQSVPVVSIAELGTVDILRDCSGAIISTEDKYEFAAKVEAVLTNRQKRTQLAEDAGKYAKTWSARHFAEKAVRFYEATLNNHGRTCETRT